MASEQVIDIYRRFRDGHWIPLSVISSDAALRISVAQHRVVLSIARNMIVINEPFACEHL